MNDIALMDMDDSLAAYSDQMVEDLNKLRSPSEPELTKGMLWDGEKLEYISRRMDLIKHMLKWLEHRPRGLGIMPVTLGNKNFKHPNVIMYDNNLEEVKEAIKKVKIRESKEELFLTST